MVKAGDLAYRMLCRKYGADLCYTPMFYSQRFVEDENYRLTEFQTCAEDRPLCVQFSGDNPEMLLKAAMLVQVFLLNYFLHLLCE